MTSSSHSYPFIRIASASPRERGRQYGHSAKERIQKTLASYGRLFIGYADLDWASVTGYARRYVDVIGGFDPDLIEEMNGIAEGSGTTFDDILAINVRTEIMYGLGDLRAVADCTAFAALPASTANGHTILGQNWDWHPDAFDSCVVLSVEQDDRPSWITVVEAGLLAKMGMNSEGVGVATNAMVSNVDRGEPGVPYHVMLRSILDSPTFDDAVSRVQGANRASSANYLIASRDGRAIDLEVIPGGANGVFPVEEQDGVIGHANCYMSPDFDVEDQTAVKKPLSLTRQRTMDTMLETHNGRISVPLMQALLAGHENQPNALCRHPRQELAPTDRSATVASMIMDLSERTVWIADGPPCTHEYRAYKASELWPSTSANAVSA